MSGAAMTRSIAALLSLLSTAAAANITLFPDGAPGEVADAVMACCAMTNVTGALLAVDGGYTAV